MVYLADCLSSEQTLEKYQIGFLYDAEAYLETLHRVMEMEASVYVPAHALKPRRRYLPAAELNIRKVHEIAGKITEICKTPVCFEEVLQALFRSYGLIMNFEQYVLVRQYGKIVSGVAEKYRTHGIYV